MELEVLKENWQKLHFEISIQKIGEIPTKFRNKSILHSQKITKRLFIFSLVEFFLWGVIGIGFQVYFSDYNPQSFLEFQPLVFIEKLNYVALGLFVLAFLLSFKTINVIGDIKLLIVRILNTKRIVNGYIYYNLAIFAITFLMSFIWELFNNSEVTVLLQDKERFVYVALIVFGVVLTLSFTILIYKIYRFVYGRFIINFESLIKNLRKLDNEF
jgi:hypothetical protein